MTKKIIGNAYQELIEIVKKYAGENMPILLSGDRGTGKELFAQFYLYQNQRRGNKKTVNCAAFTETLLESEIFGHLQGAFTGADKNRNGMAESCNNGILFLDELGASSKEFQAKILRFVEYKKIKPVGSDEEKEVDCLVIAATNAIGKIREDLRDRFITLPVPPLQKDDIPLLVRHFLKERTLKPDEMNHIIARDYPGNVRELEKACERLEIEKGDQAVCDAKPDLVLAGASFDYNRYRREIETWQTQIAPILKANKIEELQYEYQPWPSLMGKQKEFFDLLTYNILPESFSVPDEYDIPMVTLIEWLRSGIHHEEKTPYKIDISERIDPKQIPPRFRHHLRQYIEWGILPFLLEKLSKKNNKSPDKPDLSPLLNFPLNKAQDEFKRLYLKYVSEINDGDINKVAQKIGTTKKNLNQMLRRMKS